MSIRHSTKAAVTGNAVQPARAACSVKYAANTMAEDHAKPPVTVKGGQIGKEGAGARSNITRSRALRAGAAKSAARYSNAYGVATQARREGNKQSNGAYTPVLCAAVRAASSARQSPVKARCWICAPRTMNGIGGGSPQQQSVPIGIRGERGARRNHACHANVQGRARFAAVIHRMLQR